MESVIDLLVNASIGKLLSILRYILYIYILFIKKKIAIYIEYHTTHYLVATV